MPTPPANTKFYTYAKDAKAAAKPGQIVEFTKGKGYWLYTPVTPPPPSGYTPIAPTPPSTYKIPAGAELVSTTAEFVAALNKSQHDIVLANGVYDQASAFRNTNSSRIYAANVGQAKLTAGIVTGGNGGSKAGKLQGLVFDISDLTKTATDGGVHAAVNAWGNAAEDLSVLDCVFRGNKVVSLGMYSYNPQGLILQRCEGYDFTNVIYRLSDNDENSTSVINIISDIVGDGAVATTPGSTNGTGESCLWIGHPVTNGVSRVKLLNGYADCLETVNVCTGVAFTDLDITAQFVCIYIEHFTKHCTFVRYSLTSQHTGVNSEWDDGTPGNAAGHFNQFLGGTITGGRVGVYLDAGTEATTVWNTKFVGQNWAAVGAFENIGTNDFSKGNDYSGLAKGAVPLSTNHV